MSDPKLMKAMVLYKQGSPLEMREIPVPNPGPGQVLIKVTACGICRTDLHIMDSELKHPKLPLVMGHEIIGVIKGYGTGVTRFKEGDRVGVPWLGHTCGKCKVCQSGRENLCDSPLFTGYTIDGGYAEYAAADERFCFPVGGNMDDAHSAPLLCAGLIGYRSYKMCDDKFKTLGIYGFGAAAHIICQIAVWEGKEVYAFTKKGDTAGQEFAKSLGAVWAGSSDELPPVKLDASIIFAPVGALVPAALKASEKGGVVVCGGIHMSNIPEFEYRYLWEERKIVSVANLTRIDGDELIALAATAGVKTEVTLYKLEQANEALDDLRAGKLTGAAVLKID